MQNEIIRNETIIDWGHIFSSILRKRLLVALCFVLGCSAGFGLGNFADKPVYKTSATYVLSYSGGTDIMDMTSEYSFLSKILYNCVEVLNQNTFRQLIAAEINQNISPDSEDYVESESLQECVTYNFSEKNGTVIYVTVRTNDAALSYRIIDVIVQHLPEFVISQYKLAGGNSMVFSLINTPVMPEKPVASNLRMIFTALGGIAFAGICVAIIAFIALSDNRIKKEDDLTNRYNAPVLGVIPNFFDRELKKGEYYRYASYEKRTEN